MYMLYIDVEVKLEPPDEGTIICEGKLKLQLSLQKKSYHCPARLYGSPALSLITLDCAIRGGLLCQI